MIANFVLMGALYQHDPFQHVASFWNSYPWCLGADNQVQLQTTLTPVAMTKTIWALEDAQTPNAVFVGAALLKVRMFAELIVLDQWGNLGLDAGKKDPDPIPNTSIIQARCAGQITAIHSIRRLIVQDTLQEQRQQALVMPRVSGRIQSVDSIKRLVFAEANAERDAINLSLQGRLLQVLSSKR